MARQFSRDKTLGVLSQNAGFEGSGTVWEETLKVFSELVRQEGELERLHAAMEAGDAAAAARYASVYEAFCGAGGLEFRSRAKGILKNLGLPEEQWQEPVESLSGGQKTRLALSCLLLRDPDVLMLDEPANHLDLVYQKQLFEVIDLWRRQPGKAVVTVVHDLCLARRWGTHALLLEAGKVIVQGKVQQVMDSPEVNRIWRMDVGEWVCELADPWMAKKAEKGLDSIR